MTACASHVRPEAAYLRNDLRRRRAKEIRDKLKLVNDIAT